MRRPHTRGQYVGDRMHEGQMDILRAQCFNRPGVIGGDIDLDRIPSHWLKNLQTVLGGLAEM
jgi:hypothetical protein